MWLAALFLMLFSIALTLATLVRTHESVIEFRWTHWIGFAGWLATFSVLHRQFCQRLPDRDPYLLPVAAMLTGWGILTIWRLDDGFGLRQSIWLVVGGAAMFFGLRPARLLVLLRRYKYIWLVGGLLLTGLTFIFGTNPGGIGPRLWLGCCGIYLQPSEPLKLLLIIYLAAYLADNLPFSFRLPQVLLPTLLLLVVSLSILVAQRDLGTASIFIVLYSGIIFLASGKRRILAISGLGLILALIVGYSLFNVIQVRVQAWLNPWADPGGGSYQIVQSLIASASGNILGSGPGLGSPGLVPVVHSDFIFAGIAEESGLVGSLGVLLLFGLLAGRALVVSIQAPNLYQRYLAGGLSVYLATQTILITGGNLRLLPLTGVTLPFMSYGGSSLLTALFSILLLARISDHGEEEPAPLPNHRPYVILGGLLLAGLMAVGLAAGWWTIARGSDLQTRPDNPRWAIDGRYVARGALLDRSNRPIVQTNGTSGNYQRQMNYPALSSIIGYAQPSFGITNLEAALDHYLTGLAATPEMDIWIQQLLYAQPPSGLDVRLTIDLDLQQRADQLLAERHGALVLLHAQTGEILAMASHPGFDANLLNDMWSTWANDPGAPLINRATQGQYPPGATLGLLLYNHLSQTQALPATPDIPTLLFEGQTWNCGLTPANPQSWADLIASGCPAAAAALNTPDLLELYRQFGLLEAPNTLFPVAVPPTINAFKSSENAALGQDLVSVSPLQMALVAATFSNNGTRPASQIALAVDTPQSGWVALPQPQPAGQTIAGAAASAALLRFQDQAYWQVVATAHTPKGLITWYLGGTLPDWQGTPMALALVLEEDSPILAEQIGQAMFQP